MRTHESVEVSNGTLDEPVRLLLAPPAAEVDEAADGFFALPDERTETARVDDERRRRGVRVDALREVCAAENMLA